jgi:hypothetical protein
VTRTPAPALVGHLAFDDRGIDRFGDGFGDDGDDGYDPEPTPDLPDTPMWLSHHWPGQYDRCAVVGGLHVCRRCLVLYPLALVSGIVVGIGSWWPHRLDAWVLWLFPLPGVIEFVLDNLGLVRYSPRASLRRQAYPPDLRLSLRR